MRSSLMDLLSPYGDNAAVIAVCMGRTVGAIGLLGVALNSASANDGTSSTLLPKRKRRTDFRQTLFHYFEGIGNTCLADKLTSWPVSSGSTYAGMHAYMFSRSHTPKSFVSFMPFPFTQF